MYNTKPKKSRSLKKRQNRTNKSSRLEISKRGLFSFIFGGYEMDEDLMEVYFHEYCNTCAHKGVNEAEDPCDECLANPVNSCSHKPVNWKENSK